MTSDKRELAKKNPVEIFKGIISASVQLFDQQLQHRVTGFMKLVLEKKVLCHLFLIAIYQGAYGMRRIGSHQLTPERGYPDFHSTQATMFLPSGKSFRECVLERTPHCK